MKIKNGIIAGAMVLTIGMTSLSSVYASNTQQIKCQSDIMICSTGIISNTLDFKELSKDFKNNISKTELQKAETLFNKATNLEGDASKYWDEIYNLDLFDTDGKYNDNIITCGELDNNDLSEIDSIDMIEELKFEDFATEFKKDIKPEVKKKVEVLFNKANKLDKDGKYDEAMKVWDEIYEMNIFDAMIIDSSILADDAIELTNELENIEPFTFKEFSKDFKKDVKPEVVKKAKELFNKANKLDEECIKSWNKLYEMDIFKLIDFECAN